MKRRLTIEEIKKRIGERRWKTPPPEYCQGRHGSRHILTMENTLVDRGGGVTCATCAQITNKQRKQRKREEILAKIQDTSTPAINVEPQEEGKK